MGPSYTQVVSRVFDATDAWLLGAGTHTRLWEVLGATCGADGTTFRVWAPGASAVSVVGDGNGWTAGVDGLESDPSGVWRATFDHYQPGDRYKYAIVPQHGHQPLLKADPVAMAAEMPPATASVIWDADYSWGDDDWMAARGDRQQFDKPFSVYEAHLGSWRFEPGGYRAMGEQLGAYCVDMGFTHVELLPVMEHPFYGSWGYQSTGYFAPTSRYGSPEDLMALIDTLHDAGVGVLLDWVPSHFPVDDHGLGMFDGTHLFEHADPRKGFHPDWRSYVFNYDRPEVRSFLLSSAHFWLDVFHADGLRVDAVASMLYLDYSREDGEWIPNADGSNENYGAVEFLQELNRSVYEAFPDVVMVAEESTAWPGVTNPTDTGGLGFGFKWDMGWMHDTLDYFAQEPVHRSWHHDTMTFRTVYAAAEHYVLALSHDEVVHGKGSLLQRMPGDRWQQFANLRLLLGYQWTAPGKKLLFMGCEIASPEEWNHEAELPWEVLADPYHQGVQGWVRAMNSLYRELPALHAVDRDPAGFSWVVGDDRDQSVLAYLRTAAVGTESGATEGPDVLVVMNNTPVPRIGYQVGVPVEGSWTLRANSDDEGYGGSGQSPGAAVVADPKALHGHPQSLLLDLPPLGIIVLAAS
ncbi:MAG: 1,4-alpha-glucan branching protein GlgB [Actinomycetia bacterium]|nr:1,4-alpha-glucan branching protein GlgB [Actinomycetes bacterium]